MPISKKTDELYYWVDDSGITHYSNIKKETNISVQPANNYPSPQQSQNQEKPTAQIVQPTVIKPVIQPLVINPVHVATSSAVKGPLGFMVLMIVMVMGFRLFLENIEKKRREKKRSARIQGLRPEQKPEQTQTIIHNHYHTTIVTPPRGTAQSPPPIDIEFSEIMLPEPTLAPSKPFWTLEFIRSLEWREFEKLCARVLETKGFHAELEEFGPSGDGGKDIRIYKSQEIERLYGLAQCKAQKQNIQVGKIRELRGTMAKEKVAKGFFFTSGDFYKKAWEEGKEQGMELVTGNDLLAEIKSLPPEKQEAMLQEIISTDYITPTCTVCGIKMIKRSTTQSDYQFWGCVNFPKCQNTLKLRWTDKEE